MSINENCIIMKREHQSFFFSWLPLPPAVGHVATCRGAGGVVDIDGHIPELDLKR